jgi:PIN domain nuclease of toxin-antitoxin system
VLLDTHVWIWAVSDDARLGRRTRRRLHAASTKPGTLAIATVSIFEVAALHVAGRLRLSWPVERWIGEAIERSGLRVFDLDQTAAADAGLTPASALADPVDRCLVAVARTEGRPLVTADRQILSYAARTGLVTVVDARR